MLDSFERRSVAEDGSGFLGISSGIPSLLNGAFPFHNFSSAYARGAIHFERFWKLTTFPQVCEKVILGRNIRYACKGVFWRIRLFRASLGHWSWFSHERVLHGATNVMSVTFS